jgi:hypothetical protein
VVLAPPLPSEFVVLTALEPSLVEPPPTPVVSLAAPASPPSFELPQAFDSAIKIGAAMIGRMDLVVMGCTRLFLSPRVVARRRASRARRIGSSRRAGALCA